MTKPSNGDCQRGKAIFCALIETIPCFVEDQSTIL
jgi:hypothetical protein